MWADKLRDIILALSGDDMMNYERFAARLDSLPDGITMMYYRVYFGDAEDTMSRDFIHRDFRRAAALPLYFILPHRY